MGKVRILLAFLIAFAALARGASARADGPPSWLPNYELDIQLDIENRCVKACQRVTWTNRHDTPTQKLVFNVYPRYKVPDEGVVTFAKTLELLRATPSESIDPEGRRLEIQQIRHRTGILSYYFQEQPQTALVVQLPFPVGSGQSVTIELDFTLSLPEKQGRWGHYKGVTSLVNWHPVLAYYDDEGWQPMPFVAWHQPFFNEAGVYSVRIELPADQKIASTGTIQSIAQMGNGRNLVEIVAAAAREFSLVCSHRFCEYLGDAEGTRVRVLAFPEDEFHARKAVEYACEIIPLYNRWFGPYPFDEFDIVEAQFPWNGNECSGMVMLDERVLSMPKMATRYVDHLVTHETMHQWWYNIVGTNGYCETWMDEGIVTYFTTKRMQQKYGPNMQLIDIPHGFEWLPNIKYEDYRTSGAYGTLARGEATKPIQPLPGFGNVVTLFSMAYDYGGKVVGQIEQRMGTPAFTDFMRLVFAKYQFRILRVEDFQRELESYTGRSWEQFFQERLYSYQPCDWAIDDVQVNGAKYIITLKQNAELAAPTTLGVQFSENGPYELRFPVQPGAEFNGSEEIPAKMSTLPDGRVQLIVSLPSKPTQFTIDPDNLLLDTNPANNHWKRKIEWRVTPLYTSLEETDLTRAYDSWSVIAGPWFDQLGHIGPRIGLYRTQHFKGGIFAAYHTDDENIIIGADGLLDHWPFPNTQVGFEAAHGLTPDWLDARRDRGRVFGRWIRYYSSSLYQEPMEYAEIYARVENEFWTKLSPPPPTIERYDDLFGVGIRYHQDYLTPYWDPEGGYRLDVGYEHGLHSLGADHSYNRVQGEFSIVKSLPAGWGYLSQTKIAARALGAAGFPENGEHFQLGGNQRLRGIDRADRQGSLMWVGSVEWRFPLWKHIALEAYDSLARWNHLYAAAFYDVGEIYLDGASVGGVAHSVGVGLRFDISWVSFVERTTFRVDAARVVNSGEALMFWFGLNHAF